MCIKTKENGLYKILFTEKNLIEMKKTCLYPKNVKTTEPIEAYIFKATHHDPREKFPRKNVGFFYV